MRAARRARHANAHDRARLHGRRRAQGLHRAHRHRRQHAHARLRDSPRVRHRRRRPLQPRPGRARPSGGSTASATSRRSTSPTGRARRRTASSSSSRSRTSRPARSASAAAIRRRDGLHRRGRLHGDQLPRPRPICGLSVSDGQYSQRLEASFTEPYFLDQRLAGGLRSLPQEQNSNTITRSIRPGRPAEPAPRRADHRRVHVPAELFDLHSRQITDPEHASQPYDDCADPNHGPGIPGARSFMHRWLSRQMRHTTA